MESGSIPDRSELLAANPDLSEALDEYLSKLQDLNRLVVGDSPSSDIIGKQLGDFRLLRELGRGGMGVVYLAQQISLDRKVAVKLLPFASLLEPKYIERFKNEARAAAQLEHPTHRSSVVMRWCGRQCLLLRDALYHRPIARRSNCQRSYPERDGRAYD